MNLERVASRILLMMKSHLQKIAINSLAIHTIYIYELMISSKKNWKTETNANMSLDQNGCCTKKCSTPEDYPAENLHEWTED